MAIRSADFQSSRMTQDAGIAIGPILFIIAILGILAAAIAAGSGSFTTSTSGESNRTKATALIDIGQNMKVGFDRILANDVPYASVDTDVTHTTAADDLFSPIGGGIAPPSTTMSANPGTDIWYFQDVTLPAMKIGTGTSANKVAFIKVTEGVCEQINDKANKVAMTNVTVALTAEPSAAAPDAWPAALAGVPTGCIQNTTPNPDTYWFYQVLGIQ